MKIANFILQYQKRDDKLEQYTKVTQDLKLGLSDDLIAKVTVGLEPSIYKKDSEAASCSQASELETVKKNFLQKKLGLTADDTKFDAAIKKACEAMRTSNRTSTRLYCMAC